LSWYMKKYNKCNKLVKNSLTPTQWWTIDCKRRIQIRFGSQWEVIWSTTMRNCWSPRRTLSLQNSIGTVSCTPRWQNTCALK
jgi:hypothetical protein